MTRYMSSSPPLPPLVGVVFDVDGTLTVPNLDFAEMYRRCNVDMKDDILSAVAAKPSGERERAETAIEEMEDESRRTLELMPGASNLVAWLKARKVKTAVVTRNTAKTIDAVSALIGKNEVVSSPVFSPAVSRDDTSFPPKPDPSSLAHILSSWGVKSPSSEVLMVGDSPSNDVVFGKAAGVKTVLLDTGRRHTEGGSDRGADYVVAKLDELLPILKSEYSDVAKLQKYDVPKPTTEAGVAALEGDVVKLKSIYENGGLGEVCGSGNTPLIWAAEGGRTEAVKFLLTVETSSDILNARGYLGASAVTRAARRGEVDVLKLLVSDERLKPSLDAVNDKSQSPLHFAAFKRNPECVRELLMAGANPRVRDRKGRTPDQDTDVEEIRDGILEFQKGKDPMQLFLS
eukprot:CAMPEP_0118644974 /NCGR_PEP_ID=MMETSP0785-20121206/7245_1 /TAXON_ID=91992 /ORGANISM="Bolidomonas pacifica, Strain CCMP 1866" /LENGTH=401 /DNA_ID=CAMNT_0006536809 /DNA_START=129 /DNA_END=1334 /DNA_ORIENTATION=-